MMGDVGVSEMLVQNTPTRCPLIRSALQLPYERWIRTLCGSMLGSGGRLMVIRQRGGCH